MQRRRSWSEGKVPDVVELPEVGGKFQREKLPPKTKELFERIAAIWDIPVDEMMPVRGAMAGDLKAGEAHPSTHLVDLKVDDKQTRIKRKSHRLTTEHELAHIAHFIISPDRSVPDPIEERPGLPQYSNPKRFIRERVYSEPLANAGKSLRSIANLGVETKIFLLPTFAGIQIGTIITLLLAGSAPAELFVPLGALALSLPFADNLRDNAVRRFTDKYGPDGWILLAVDNPYRLFKYRIAADERRYLKEGLLYPPNDHDHHGLTPKGMECVRAKMPRERILEKLDAVRRNRKLLEKRG